MTTLYAMIIAAIVAGLIGARMFLTNKSYYGTKDKVYITFAFLLPGLIATALIFGISRAYSVMDTQIISGEITSKSRDHGQYTERYECNCRETCRGSGKDRRCSKTCDTCTREHYTVKWVAHSNINSFTIKSLDETSRSVYNTPDPERYTVVKPGDPVSEKVHYENLTQAVPESLYAVSALVGNFEGLLPEYPESIYDIYKIDRFVSPGFSFANARVFNDKISEAMKTLGPQKQANLVVVIAKTADQSYTYALQKHWEGVNKNDVVLVIGSLDGKNIEFVSVLSWTKNELFKIELRDSVLEHKVINPEIVDIAARQIAKNFERRKMKEFEYLRESITPPPWAIVLNLILLLCVPFIPTGYGYFNQMMNRYRRPYRRF